MRGCLVVSLCLRTGIGISRHRVARWNKFSPSIDTMLVNWGPVPWHSWMFSSYKKTARKQFIVKSSSPKIWYVSFTGQPPGSVARSIRVTSKPEFCGGEAARIDVGPGPRPRADSLFSTLVRWEQSWSGRLTARACTAAWVNNGVPLLMRVEARKCWSWCLSGFACARSLTNFVSSLLHLPPSSFYAADDESTSSARDEFGVCCFIFFAPDFKQPLKFCARHLATNLRKSLGEDLANSGFKALHRRTVERRNVARRSRSWREAGAALAWGCCCKLGMVSIEETGEITATSMLIHDDKIAILKSLHGNRGYTVSRDGIKWARKVQAPPLLVRTLHAPKKYKSKLSDASEFVVRFFRIHITKPRCSNAGGESKSSDAHCWPTRARIE